MSKELIERLRDIAGDMNYCNGRMCAAEGTMDEAADRLEKHMAVVEAARAMADDYEAYDYNSVTGKWDRPLFPEGILRKWKRTLAALDEE